MKKIENFFDKKVFKRLKKLGISYGTSFRDLAYIDPKKRYAKTEVLNIYSAANNIGNYLPVMAIHKYVGEQLDCWGAHDKNIDYEFINKNYKFIIVGGAGLLHPSFERFWKEFHKRCKLPFIVWGVGVCLPSNMSDQSICNRPYVRESLAEALLVNLRDELSAELTGATEAVITPCPTLGLLSGYIGSRSRSNEKGELIYAPHNALMSEKDKVELKSYCQKLNHTIYTTYNAQYPWCTLWELIERYNSAKLVVTSRLHGAIIAWSLNKPFVALARDQKLIEFGRMYAQGQIVTAIEELEDFNFDPIKNDSRQYLDSVNNFAVKALSTIEDVLT